MKTQCTTRWETGRNYRGEGVRRLVREYWQGRHVTKFEVVCEVPANAPTQPGEVR